jgi:8-oxo-dGTP pyrophosphatase MutT (NUDIX family)
VKGEPRRIEQECVEAYVFTSTPPRLLILLRPPDRGSLWVPVSGKVDPGDKGFESAVRRELLEETGFDALERLFPLDWEVEFEGPDGRPWRLHAYAADLESPQPPQLSAEHVAAEWVDFDEAERRLSYADNREAVHRLRRRLPRPGQAVA